MKLAVVTPSRGLVHTRTIESVLETINLARAYEGIVWKYFFSHDKPIPDAQNYLVKQALDWDADYIFSVEEDNIVPKEALTKMLHKMRLPPVGVACVDYPVTEKGVGGVCKKGDKILWCPLGCTLIASWVFEKIEKPWFDTSYSWQFISKNPLELKRIEVPNKYGGHDINFGLKCNDNNILIVSIDKLTAGHIKPKMRHGDAFYNNEVKEFEIWTEIKEHQVYG